MFNKDSFRRVNPNGTCDNDDCSCDEQPEGMRHERSIPIPISLLHYLSQEAMCHLVFLEDGRVWVGYDSDDLRSLALQLDAEDEAVQAGWDQLQQQVAAKKVAPIETKEAANA